MSTTHPDDKVTRRDFLYIATGGVTVVGAALAGWAIIDSMYPSANILALSTVEIDLAPVEEGQSITVVWRGKPTFVRNRTAEEIARAVNSPNGEAVNHFKVGTDGLSAGRGF